MKHAPDGGTLIPQRCQLLAAELQLAQGTAGVFGFQHIQTMKEFLRPILRRSIS